MGATFYKVAFWPHARFFAVHKGAWPKWPNGKCAYRPYVSSPGTLKECRKYSLLFIMAVVDLRLRFIKWKLQIIVFYNRKGVIMLTYSRGPMTSLAWGPVGHCTSGRPLNPPLQRYITVELMFAVYAQRRRRSRHTTLQLLRRSRLPSSHGFPATTEATLYTTFCGQ